MDQKQLRAGIRERMQSGLIPGGREAKTYGGRGTNSACVCCSANIDPRQVEYEVYFDGYPDPFRAHVSCYRVWWEEREYGETPLSDAMHSESRDTSLSLCESTN